MKKTLLSLAAVLSLSTAFASTATFNVNDATDFVGTEVAEVPAEGSSNGQARHIQPLESFKLGGYTYSFKLNAEKGNAPAYYWNMSTSTNTQNTVRVYVNNEITITAPEGVTFGKINLKGSNGKDGLTITASAGAATYASQNVSWVNSEPVSSVTLSFSGSFRITEITIDTEAGTVVTPPVSEGLLDIDFKSSLGGFTFEQGTLPEGLTEVWVQDTKYGLKASGYKNGTFATDAWAISPVVEITGVEKPVLTFNQAANNFKLNGTNIDIAEALKMISVSIREEGGEWTAIDVPNKPASLSWNFVESGDIDLSAYIGKKIQIGFRYTSTAEIAGTWEIGYIKIAGEGDGGGDTPVVKPEYDLLVNNATEIDGTYTAEKPAEGDSYAEAAHYRPFNSAVIGDYYFSFSSTNTNENSTPALYLPMSTSTTGNSNFRVYKDSKMTIAAPENVLMTRIDIDGSNADSGLVIAADKGSCTLDGNAASWSFAEGTNSVTLSFDKKYRMYGFKITTVGSGAVESIENAPVVAVVGNDIIAPENAVVYSLNGVIVGRNGLASGIYIVRIADKTVKVIVK